MKTIALASVAIAVTLIGAAATTTLIDSREAAPTTSGPAAPTDQAASAELQQLADEIYQSFSGTRYERDAGAVLAAYALNGPLAECMHQSGFPEWDWSLNRAMNPENHGLEESLFFHAPLTTPFADMKMTVSPMIRAEEATMATDLSDQEMQVGLECLNSTPQTPEADASPTPPGIIDLREQWWAMMADLDETLGERDAYWTCMSEKTVDGTGGVDSNEALLELLESRTPPPSQIPESPSSPEASTPAWTSLVEFEREWRAVEFSCRAGVYDAGIDEVKAALEEFANVHASEITAAGDAWNDTVDRARDLGYAGQFGSLLTGFRTEATD
jgi:hypothetical protein